MTAARLSPAANLLRNSRLFALPSPISLPTAERYTEGNSSDTATTIHPTRAALETPKTSLKRGDWGLKRELPIKTTTKTGTPTFRIRGGIDTPEHIADFESAADHVINLRKFQELDLRITLPDDKGRAKRDNLSPFTPALDNTTADQLPDVAHQDESISWLKTDAAQRTARLPTHLRATLEQYEGDKANEADSSEDFIPPTDATTAPRTIGTEKRRWRYTGPYLAGITEFEFDTFLKQITPEKKKAFREVVKQHLISQRIADQRSKALDEGSLEELSTRTTADVADDEVSEHLRNLRSEPGQFGPLIASFFDLADGPQQDSGTDPWSYGRDTITAHRYRQTGPPKTHPSAGLSYQYSGRYILNDVKSGPLEGRRPAPSRILQSSISGEGMTRPSLGVAGFVASTPSRMGMGSIKWELVPGGPKCVVDAEAAVVTQMGKLDIQASVKSNWRLKNDIPVADSDAKDFHEQVLAKASKYGSSRTPALRKARGGRVKIDMDIVAEMDRLTQSASQSSNSQGRS